MRPCGLWDVMERLLVVDHAQGMGADALDGFVLQHTGLSVPYGS